jgi:ribulose-phosphate 3-epimerase
VEVDADPARLLAEIGRLGLGRGLAVNPGTPVDPLLPHLESLDLILVMSVEPGFGGQSFLPGVLDKVRSLRAVLAGRGLEVPIEIDGGVGPANAEQVVGAGAEILVAASSIFGTPDPAGATRKLRDRALAGMAVAENA